MSDSESRGGLVGERHTLLSCKLAEGEGSSDTQPRIGDRLVNPHHRSREAAILPHGPIRWTIRTRERRCRPQKTTRAIIKARMGHVLAVATTTPDAV